MNTLLQAYITTYLHAPRQGVFSFRFMKSLKVFKNRFWKGCVQYGTHRAEMAIKHRWML